MQNGANSWLYACLSGNLELVRKLAVLPFPIAGPLAVRIVCHLDSLRSPQPTLMAVCLMHHDDVSLLKLTQTGKDALMFACESGEVDTVQWLLKEFPGQFSFARETRRKENAFWFALIGGHIDMMDWLIAAGADINFKVRAASVNPLLVLIPLMEHALIMCNPLQLNCYVGVMAALRMNVMFDSEVVKCVRFLLQNGACYTTYVSIQPLW